MVERLSCTLCNRRQCRRALRRHVSASATVKRMGANIACAVHIARICLLRRIDGPKIPLRCLRTRCQPHWSNDYLWLPSLVETGYNGITGIWNLSQNQRSNGMSSWLRSGNFTVANIVFALDTFVFVSCALPAGALPVTVACIFVESKFCSENVTFDPVYSLL